MTIPERSVLPQATWLDKDRYLPEFREAFGTLQGPFCKLESRQHFIESGNESWEAFAAGRWSEALETLNGPERMSTASAFAESDARGVRRIRVRVVNEPLTPYMQWELNYLLMRHDLGEQTRVCTGDQAAAVVLVPTMALPEIVVLGDVVCFEIGYNRGGELVGAFRCTDPDIIRVWSGAILRLWESSVDLSEYFKSRVAPLAEPIL